MNQKQNPYLPNQIHVEPSKTSHFSFSHSRAINYVFENPKWMQNVLLTTVCIFIPIVGPIILYGYQAEVVECLHRERGRRYPDFDFNRFSEYLTRGLWVFLVALVINLVMVPVMWIAMIGGIALMGGAASAVGPDAAGWSFLVTFPLMIVLMSGASILMAAVSIPMFLRTGLTQEFSEGFNFSFVMEFIGNTWKQIVLSTLFLYFFSMAVTLVGLLVFCVGAYVAGAYVCLVASHVGWQLYEVHLAKGGSRVPLKPTVSYPPAPTTY